MKEKLKSILTIILMTLAGAVIGYLVAYYAGSQLTNLEKPNILLLIAMLPLSIILQIIIHEAGHLVFGLLSGYKFISFKVFNYALVKENNKISFKNVQGIQGTAGQCLMAPPEFKSGAFPYKLYLIGGALFNVIFSIIVWKIFPNFYTLIFATVGLIAAITNIIPMGFNDGMSIKLVNKNEVNRYAFYIGLLNTAYASQGKSYAVEHPEVLEKIKELDNKEHNHIADYLDFLEIEYYQDRMELKKVYDGLLKLYYEREDMILPYRIEVMRSLIMLTSLFEPEKVELIDSLMKDKSIKARFKTKEPQNKTILATYEWRVNNNHEKALEILEEGRRLLHRTPHLYAKIIEERQIDYIESLIKEEMAME